MSTVKTGASKSHTGMARNDLYACLQSSQAASVMYMSYVSRVTFVPVRTEQQRLTRLAGLSFADTLVLLYSSIHIFSGSIFKNISLR